jgi:hypothetical protein
MMDKNLEKEREYYRNQSREIDERIVKPYKHKVFSNEHMFFIDVGEQ